MQLLLQISAESLQTFPDFSQWSSQNYDEDLKIEILIIFFRFFLTWDPMGVQISKCYSSYKSQPNVYKLVLNFPPNGPSSQSNIGDFGNFEFAIFNDVCPKFSNSPLYSIEKPKTSILWKTGNRRAKRSEIWDSV